MKLAQRTRFVESDDDEDATMGPATSAGPSQPAPAPPVLTPTPASSFSLLSSISTDYDTKDQCYVLHLAAAPSGTLAAALSNRLIKLYSLTDGGVQFTGNLSGHTGTITSAQCPLPEEPHLLLTSSRDGSVREWDLRSGQATRLFNAGNQEVACCATNGNFMAAGAKDNVLFWDRGSGKPASSFVDTHFQDVSQVAFHPTSRSSFISGSEDGLIAVFNTAGGLDEDEGFQAALNIDTAVAQFGFYGPGGDKLWCCSGTETLHLWEWAAACDDDSLGGNGALGQSLDAREKVRMPVDRAAADYLLQCEYDPTNDQLVVVAGSSGGEAAFFPVEQPPTGAAAPDLRFGSAATVLSGGHSDIIRSMVWLGGSGPLWVTGGEDSRVCLWSSAPGAVGPQPSASGGSSSDGAARNRGQSHMRRASPY